MIEVVSSNLNAIGYDRDSQTLVVAFKNGQRWRYTEVPPTLFRELQTAPSVGKFFALRIKDFFKGEKEDKTEAPVALEKLSRRGTPTASTPGEVESALALLDSKLAAFDERVEALDDDE